MSTTAKAAQPERKVVVLEADIDRLQATVDKACAEMDHLRAVNKELLEALTEAILPTLQEAYIKMPMADHNKSIIQDLQVMKLKAEAAIAKARVL